jgi:AcrR family transcriptional regulator
MASPKAKYIEAAYELLVEEGLENASIRKIAARAGTSSTALYKHFDNKEELLYEGVRLEQARTVERAKEIIRNANGTMEVILSLYYLYINRIRTINKNYFRELEKYPKVIEENQRQSRKNEHKIRAWLESGTKEGIFREDTNFEILLYIVKDSVKFITTTTLFDHYSIEQMSDTFILAYLRGVSTAKGQQIIEEYIKKNQITE